MLESIHEKKRSDSIQNDQMVILVKKWRRTQKEMRIGRKQGKNKFFQSRKKLKRVIADIQTIRQEENEMKRGYE